MPNFEQGMGSGRDQENPNGAPEQGLGASERGAQSSQLSGGPEQGMGARESATFNDPTGAPESGMGKTEGATATGAGGAAEQGMGVDQSGSGTNGSTDDYGMGAGSGRNDQKEGEGGKLLGKVKGMLHKDK
ncbi:uncharacterized protein AB675_3713 [Cyphellophora attinorum]|uniref:Uncharacterized protein n=1 Tax=Cyphellophora attinorum TaxID=1664694 RepID=A0A0N1NYQ2_9EURO|nr:uncharacterized protein AB675_3713 [Phialophora attinorum]KPI37112.1 hypothetical protein AB675_3713 [Phialophora attinorum]